jgi:hypothetical protein
VSEEPEILETEPVPPVPPARPAADAGAADLAKTAWKTRRAWFVAIGADLLQWGLFPLFAWGGLAPWDLGVDLVVAFLLTRWMGWHLAFLPAFVTELIPTPTSSRHGRSQGRHRSRSRKP